VYPAGTKLGVVIQKNKTRNSYTSRQAMFLFFYCWMAENWWIQSFALLNTESLVNWWCCLLCRFLDTPKLPSPRRTNHHDAVSLFFLLDFGCCYMPSMWNMILYSTQLWSGVVKFLSDVWCYCCLNPEVFDSFCWIILIRSSCCKVVSVILLGTDWPFDLDLDAHAYMFYSARGSTNLTYHIHSIALVWNLW
jgi:hypothetical protein